MFVCTGGEVLTIKTMSAPSEAASKGKKRRASGAFSSAAGDRPAYRVDEAGAKEVENKRPNATDDATSLDPSIFDHDGNEEKVMDLVETKARAEKHRKRKESPDEYETYY